MLTRLGHRVQWFFVQRPQRSYRYQEQRSEAESWPSQKGILRITKGGPIQHFMVLKIMSREGQCTPTRTALAPPAPPAMNDLTLSIAVAAAALAVAAVTSSADSSFWFAEQDASA